MAGMRQKARLLVAGVGLGVVLLAGGALGNAVAAVSTMSTAQANPAGDIPDTQAFVTFASRTGGYQLQVPEGWARTARGADVLFTDALDGVGVTVTSAAHAPSEPGARGAVVAAITRSGHAVKVTKVENVRLPGGAAVLAEYTSTSDPDPVTNRQVRLEDTAYLFFRAGKVATLTLWAPVGADNVDQWQRMAHSFRWL